MVSLGIPDFKTIVCSSICSPVGSGYPIVAAPVCHGFIRFFWSFLVVIWLGNKGSRLKSIQDIKVSWNGGTPKSSILIGFCIINQPFWGYLNSMEIPHLLGVFKGGGRQNDINQPPTDSGSPLSCSHCGGRIQPMFQFCPEAQLQCMGSADRMWSDRRCVGFFVWRGTPSELCFQQNLTFDHVKFCGDPTSTWPKQMKARCSWANSLAKFMAFAYRSLLEF